MAFVPLAAQGGGQAVEGGHGEVWPGADRAERGGGAVHSRHLWRPTPGELTPCIENHLVNGAFDEQAGNVKRFRVHEPAHSQESHLAEGGRIDVAGREQRFIQVLTCPRVIVVVSQNVCCERIECNGWTGCWGVV